MEGGKNWSSIDITVRRENALDFSGFNSRPGTGSLHLVAIEAAAEATKLLELSTADGIGMWAKRRRRERKPNAVANTGTVVMEPK
jgi:hypothetical protein